MRSIAVRSPLIQRSNGASSDTIERSKVASACSILGVVMSPLPNAASNAVDIAGDRR